MSNTNETMDIELTIKSGGDPAWVKELRLKALHLFQTCPWGKGQQTEGNVFFQEISVPVLAAPPAVPDGSYNVKFPGEGIQVLPLSTALKTQEGLIRAAWEKAIDQSAGNKFRLLHLALWSSGTVISILPQTSTSANLQSLQGGEPRDSKFTLNFIFIGEAATVEIWDEPLNTTRAGQAIPSHDVNSDYLILDLKTGAQVEFLNIHYEAGKNRQYRFQDISQESRSRFSNVTMTFGGFKNQSDIAINLNGEGSENKMLGVHFGHEDQIFENRISQHHHAPNTVSDIQYRSVLKGRSESHFNGLISIYKKANKSNAYQSFKSLLLSRNAKAEAVPNLEILTDDVQCSHGAAVGPVDEDQKYYLQSRGFSPPEAEKMIIEGFFEPVIEAIPSLKIREQLKSYIERNI